MPTVKMNCPQQKRIANSRITQQHVKNELPTVKTIFPQQK
jgi:hypothetical protein